MCGIWAYFRSQGLTEEEKQKLLPRFRQQIKKIRHRGPDWSGSYLDTTSNYTVFIAHERLAINGLSSGAQPICNLKEGLILSVNGEIYNHKDFDKVFKQKYEYLTESDCESLMYLYQDAMTRYEADGTKDFKTMENYLKTALDKIRGIFTFILYDQKRKQVLVSRDIIGVNSLYYGCSSDNELYISSEMKALEDCTMVKVFLPGQFLVLGLDKFIIHPFCQYYEPNWMISDTYLDGTLDDVAKKVHDGLIAAVEGQLMTEVPFGVLLSGGLDSSLIASISQRLVSKGVSKDWGDKIHTFSIGLNGSPDVEAAQNVADFLGTRHHSFEFTVAEAEAALEDVVYHLETYDVTTIRASTPMYLLSRRIKAMGIKMVLSGEGSDEIFGGYLYFHYAPNAVEFQKECKALISRLHYSDCLRANKSTMAWGIEARVPFLDRDFMDLSVLINPEMKMAARGGHKKKIEKYILRYAFKDGYLPDEFLWRQKEQFSDGVGYGWIDHLKKIAQERVTDSEVSNHKMMTGETLTKEALNYLKMYDKLFPGRRNILPRWKPKTDWEGVTTDDASGRSMKVHEKAY
jgi:asparagine synthase (glutamine-hydrolysing)